MLELVKNARSTISSRFGSDRGATAVEYGLLIALVGGALITALVLFGSSISNLFSQVGNKLTITP